ncbi:oligogalacturonate lyase family protein [Halalkalibacter sp. APA_J-10(15)]|uniref:oligogalacturonate lyase family protein n=1 Tax=Halalkalibacter sp. APA_J-10(15) TaxID=2933805 RepID=UPI001FF1973D|nr:oligogalacturonate lyase family protein [Halalkalibacter sp. APA_J-10(15)]MCK0469857.1 oligogalacturonate lyase family protein [Halalkalibacter sp. APA_J-10(15)]
MGKGTTWSSEKSTFTDPMTGASITQWTDYLAHSYHLYFTNDGWYDDGAKLLVCSERGNAVNLYSLDTTSGQLTQLTDLDKKVPKGIQGTYINPQKNEAYFTYGKSIVLIHLETYEETVIYTKPDGYHFSNISCTADGQALCFGLSEDLSQSISTNLSGGYVGFEETEAARPHCQIYLLTLATGEARVIHEEKRWIGHVNASPTQSHIISFCHEGPWEKVDHRIWAMNVETGEVWKIREGEPNQYAGHEYWHADGIHIGYHGFTDSLDRKDGKFLGYAKYDNSTSEEFEFPYQNMHIHSNGATLIVGDGQQASAYHGERYQDCIFLWRKTAFGMEGPRVLCKHRGSFQVQQVHVHPRLTSDGSKVLFTSDRTGYGNVYVVDVPEFESLPKVMDGKLVKD